MKLSEVWLRERVHTQLTTDELCQKLTLSGLEVESVTPVAEKFSNVVIAEIIQIDKHPEADRLHICQVNVGQPELLTIVCGGTNLRLGMKVPAALVGATLPNNIKITRSKLRGVVSNGMLCSARELTLAEEAKGIYEFPPDAPIGLDAWEYLKLTDQIIDISITPNRGDCLSVAGMAREIAAITGGDLREPSILTLEPTISDKLSVKVNAVAECPLYAGRVIADINANSVTPIWLQERLRRSGMRCIHPVVDIMNYVMLELGQPMHAFDLQKINGVIQVRLAQPGEKLLLLDEQEVELTPETLIIADDKQPLAIAGIMGGLNSAVSKSTTTVFLESAFFTPVCIARTRQHYQLNSESSYRFERGVRPVLQVKALERATELLLEIVGGQAGPIVEVMQVQQMPLPLTITLRAERIARILGFKIDDAKVEALLKRAGFNIQKYNQDWNVEVPEYRFDVKLEVDLIEEIIRLYGYDQLPLHQTRAALTAHTREENKLPLEDLRNTLRDLGYHEVITYSFVKESLQQLLDPSHPAKVLENPITADMSVMRTNLWPGLIEALLYNQNRQQERVRIFEVGTRFLPSSRDGVNEVVQQKVISGLVSGNTFPLQWGSAGRPVDFFDLKGDLENVIKLTFAPASFHFKVGEHAALHPGKTAILERNGQNVGIFGALHPEVARKLDISGSVLLFELLLDELLPAKVPHALPLSKFPEIRRDIAILIEQTVPAQQIQDTIVEVSGDLLKEINVFDVYQGKGVPQDRKSIALALTLQHAARTLLDEEVADVMERVISALKQRFAAELRG